MENNILPIASRGCMSKGNGLKNRSTTKISTSQTTDLRICAKQPRNRIDGTEKQIRTTRLAIRGFLSINTFKSIGHIFNMMENENTSVISIPQKKHTRRTSKKQKNYMESSLTRSNGSIYSSTKSSPRERKNSFASSSPRRASSLADFKCISQISSRSDLLNLNSEST